MKMPPMSDETFRRLASFEEESISAGRGKYRVPREKFADSTVHGSSVGTAQSSSSQRALGAQSAVLTKHARKNAG